MTHPGPEQSFNPISPSELVTPVDQYLAIIENPLIPQEAKETIALSEGRNRGLVAAQLLVSSLHAEQVQGLESERDEAIRLATTDSLTGLPNRLGITKDIETLVEEYPGEFGVLFVDLDGLKAINDTLGHDRGNEFIQGAADALSSGIRRRQTPEHPEPRQHDTEGHMAARLSGDEFVVVVKGVTTEEQLEMVGSRLRKILDEAGISASLGPALHRAGEKATDVIRRADFAMYEVKEFRRQMRLEAHQEAGRASLPADRREMYEAVAVVIWEFPGASEEEFHDLYRQSPGRAA